MACSKIKQVKVQRPLNIMIIEFKLASYGIRIDQLLQKAP